VVEEGKSGKRVVAVLLGLVLLAGLIAWLGATRLEKSNREGQDPGGGASASVLSEGVLYEARSGDPSVVIAKDVGSGKELWRAELGAVTSKPALSVHEELIEVQIAGTPWMTLDRSTGEPVE
jgi:Flp pilus assembly protein CpaB